MQLGYRTPMRRGPAPLLLAAAWLGGCGASLSSFQPAHVPERGHVQTEAGFDLAYPVHTIGDVIDAAETIEDAAAERTLTDDEIRIIAEGGAALGMNPPAVIGHLGVAGAPLERLELGARLMSSGWRLGFRYQLLTQARHGVDLTAGFGAGTALTKPVIEEALDSVTVDRYWRWNIDVPVALGRHGTWYRWWVGPRLLYSRSAQELTVQLPYDVRVRGQLSGGALYLGGQGGAALGYRSIFVGPELTIVGLMGSVDVDLLGRTEPVRLDTAVVQPAFAVMGEF
jgi:hypothetical protein